MLMMDKNLPKRLSRSKVLNEWPGCQTQQLFVYKAPEISTMDYLTTLLPELQIQVIEYLDYISLAVLSQTSQYLRTNLQVQSPTATPQQKILYLFAAEEWKR